GPALVREKTERAGREDRRSHRRRPRQAPRRKGPGRRRRRRRRHQGRRELNPRFLRGISAPSPPATLLRPSDGWPRILHRSDGGFREVERGRELLPKGDAGHLAIQGRLAQPSAGGWRKVLGVHSSKNDG